MPTTANRFFVGWRNWLARMIPNWQTLRPGAQTGFKFLWAMAAPVDILLELLLQGLNDWAPGSPNASPTALTLIGRSRGLIQGEAETADHFALRLINWRTNGLAVAPPATPRVWSQRGRTELLALQIQQYLGNTPMVRIIERIPSSLGAPRATYTTASTDGTTSVVAANWNWDGWTGWTDEANTYDAPTVRGWWSDFWIVVYPGEWDISGDIAPLTGQRVHAVSHDVILAVLADWKGCFTFCRAIIFSYNAALFDPADPGHAGNPDGTWGNWAYGSVPARNVVDARYWIPPRG
jgi:hypothetical protein